MFPHGYREAPARPNVACGKTPLQTKPSHSKGSEFRLCRKIAQSEAKTQIWTGLGCVSLLDLLSQNTRNSRDSQNSQGIQDNPGPPRTTRNDPKARKQILTPLREGGGPLAGGRQTRWMPVVAPAASGSHPQGPPAVLRPSGMVGTSRSPSKPHTGPNGALHHSRGSGKSLQFWVA